MLKLQFINSTLLKQPNILLAAAFKKTVRNTGVAVEYKSRRNNNKHQRKTSIFLSASVSTLFCGFVADLWRKNYTHTTFLLCYLLLRCCANLQCLSLRLFLPSEWSSEANVLLAQLLRFINIVKYVL